MGVNIQECPECGGTLEVSTGQAIHSGELSWFRSCRCEQCEFATEEDGSERDEEIRNEILSVEGESILLVEIPDDRSRALAEARRAFGFGMPEVLRLRQIDTSCVASGTRVEMELLRHRLDAKGINAHVSTIPHNTRTEPDGE